MQSHLYFYLVLLVASTTSIQNNMLDDKPNLFVIPTQTSYSLWGAVNSDGSLQIPPIYKTLGEFDDDASIPSRVQTVDGKWAYINRDGEFVHPATLDSAMAFTKERLARFEKDGLWGFITPTGDYAVKPIYQQAGPFYNGYAPVKQEHGWSFIDTSGKLLFDHTFERLGDFSPAGLAAAYNDESDSYGYINTRGDWQIEAKFERVTSFGKANRASVEKDEKWGIIDQEGNWVVKPNYENMDEFGDKNFTAFYVDWDRGGLIDVNGNIIFDHREKRFFEPYSYPHCNVVTTERSAPTFYDLSGKRLERLNKPKFRIFNGFNSQCISLAMAGDNDKWTRLKSDGSRRDFPDEVQEPHFSWDGESTKFTLSDGDFIPVTLKDRSLAYLDADNNIALRTSTEISSKGDILIVSDVNDKEIWRHVYDKNTLIENNQYHFFLTKGNLEFGYEKPTKKSISQKIEQLKQKPPAPFEVSYSADLDSGDGDSFGTALRLANANYAYFDHSSAYRDAIDWPDFTAQFKEVKDVITSLLGEPTLDDERIEDLLEENDIYESGPATWLVDGSVLVLHETYYEDGDVDSWASLNLLLLPTKETKGSLTSLEVVAAKALNISAKSAREVSAAATELRENFKYNSAAGLRQLAVKVLALAQDGKKISRNDYVWAHYGQLFAAFYDDADELQVGTQEEFVALALNILDFLDSNGVGEDRLTAEGQTRLDVYRYAANRAALELREDDPAHALEIIERALSYARPQDTYLYDTQVRILLNLDKQYDAFAVVKRELDENPWYEGFNDFTENKKYKKWVKKQDGKFIAYADIPSTTQFLQENQTIAVDPAHDRLAVYWNDELHMFDLSNAKPIFSVNTGTYHPFSMGFNSDGRQLISSGWDEVAIWDTASGKKIVKRKNSESNSKCAGFGSLKDTYFYESESYDGSNHLTVSNYADHSLLTLAVGHNCNTSDDHHFLAINGTSDDQRDQIEVVDLEKHKVVATLVGSQASPYDDDLFFVQDNTKLLVRDYSNFHLWDIARTKVETTWDTDSLDVDEVVATNDFVFVLDGDQFVARLWRFGEQPGDDILLPIPNYANGSENYRGFKVNKALTQYVVATENAEESLRYIFVFDFNSHKLIKEFVLDEDFGEVFFSNKDRHLILDSYPIQVLDLKSGDIIHRIRRPY